MTTTSPDLRPLSGLVVVEVGGTIPVAAATKLFSDYGADVVKVEPSGGASLRRIGPFPGDVPDLESGAFHVALDTGKRSVTLDLDSPSGLEVLTRLAERADLVLLHLPLGEARTVREDLMVLGGAEGGPHVVVLSEHGLDGPFAGRRENGTSLFAWTGRMHQHSLPGEEPLRYAPYLPEMQWGATAAAVSLACVHSTEHGGQRREVEVSAVEALTGNVDTWFLQWEFTGAEMPRASGQSKAAYPAGCYRCADGYVVFASANPPFFNRLCEAIGRPELAEDPRFLTPAEKALHFDDFFEVLDPWLRERTRDEIFTYLQSFGVMVSPMLDPSEVVTDRQAVARGSFVTHELPATRSEGGTTLLAGPPFRLDAAWDVAAAPRLGEHTDEVLRELGYTTTERLALFRAGVTG